MSVKEQELHKMISALNTQSQKYLVGVIQATPGTPVLEEIADIFRNYYIR